jgi:Putative metal-binding motif/Divergent InlB B-repeat domain
VAPANTVFRSVALAPCADIAWYRDNDGDSFGDPTDVIMFCTQPLGYVSNNTDCNDNSALNNPAAVWYLDADGDGYSNGTSIAQCQRPTNYFASSELIATTGDCNDALAAINPAAAEVCDGVDNDCDTQIDENTNDITTTVTGNGSISPVGPVAVSCGGSQTFNFTPDACYQVSDVKVNGVSQGALSSYTFTSVTAAQTIEVIYSQISYAVNVTIVGNGTVTGASSVGCGSNISLLCAADDCYTIETITVNGTEVAQEMDLEFTTLD